MGITQVPQPLQRSLDLPYSLLEHFLTEGRGANRTAEEAKAIAGDRYLGWQGGKGGITDIRDEKEGLASIEMEADRGARRLHNVEGRREVLSRAHQSAIVKVPGIQSKRGYLGSDTLDDGMES